MALTLEMFDPFKLEDENADIVSDNKLGVMVATDGEWVATQITEADLGNYTLFNIENEEGQNDEKAILIQKISDVKNSNDYASWPYVSLTTS